MNIFEWDENIPVTANNLNEMQNIINNNIIDIYSTDEVKTNMVWIDNKPVYRKVIEGLQLPNTNVSSYNTNVSNIDKVTKLYGFCSNNLFLNGSRPEDTTAEIGAWYDPTQEKIKISTGKDRSNLTATVIIEYTKTTD